MLFFRFWREEFFSSAVCFLGIFTRFKPINIRASGCFSSLSVPSGGTAFFHLLARIGGEKDQFFSALRTIFIERLSRSVYPFDIITSRCFSGLTVPSSR